MTLNALRKEIEEAVPKLLDMARELTRNHVSDNCKFILTEIRDSQESFHVQRRLKIKENNMKAPKALHELIPTLQILYSNLYDINLNIYKANKHLTIIDIRYYLKSSLDSDSREKVLNNPPMLHSRVAIPPWLPDKKEKFDINWEHKQWLIKWKLFCAK